MLKKLSTNDASFLAVENPNVPMHVGWLCTFSPPPDGPRPTFEQLRDHITGRLAHSPRYRQRLVQLPLRAWEPAWVDDSDFDFANHVVEGEGDDITAIVDEAMSSHLERDRPLWKMWLAPELSDGRIGFVGKAHHCMVDGLAALELVGLLFDESAEPEPTEPVTWEPRPLPSRRVLGVVRLNELAERVRGAVRLPLRLMSSEGGPRSLGPWAARVLGALVDFARPAPMSPFNGPSSRSRHQARTTHPLDELRAVKDRFDTSLNDVVLAVAAGALRRYTERRGHAAERLKALVPVNVRDPTADPDELGNQLSSMWIELPCEEPDPLRRLKAIHASTKMRKDSRRAEGASVIMAAVSYGPRFVKWIFSSLFASHRTANVVVSNLIGPPIPLYMNGCELEEIYPVVPLTNRHGVSIGLMTVRDTACFSLYADAGSLPDADLLAADIDASVAELVALAVDPADDEFARPSELAASAPAA